MRNLQRGQPASIVPSAPRTMGALTCPMWPMRNHASAGDRPSPIPRVSPATRSHHSRSRSASGDPAWAAVTAHDRSAGSPTFNRTGPFDDHTSNAAQIACASTSCRRQTFSIPSALIMSSATEARTDDASVRSRRNTASIPPGSPWPPVPVPRDAIRPLPRPVARSLKNTKHIPGGTISPFWLAATITSAPQASISNRSQPSDAMQSAINNAGCPPGPAPPATPPRRSSPTTTYPHAPPAPP